MGWKGEGDEKRTCHGFPPHQAFPVLKENAILATESRGARLQTRLSRQSSGPGDSHLAFYSLTLFVPKFGSSRQQAQPIHAMEPDQERDISKV